MTAEHDLALLVLIWLGTAAMCGGIGLLYWAIFKYYRSKRLNKPTE